MSPRALRSSVVLPEVGEDAFAELIVHPADDLPAPFSLGFGQGLEVLPGFLLENARDLESIRRRHPLEASDRLAAHHDRTHAILRWWTGPDYLPPPGRISA